MRRALPRIGVVVLNWNGRRWLQPCLESLLASDHPDFDVIVVDNASGDGSVAWMRAEHPELHLLALEENRRFAGGNNAGAQAALARGAEIVLLLNNDTTVAPDMLRGVAECFAEHPENQIVGPRICYADQPERIWYGGGEMCLALGIARHRAIRRGIDDGADPAGPTDWVTGCALAVRAELWTRLGGLDEAFYIYAEDVDFCLRARALGAPIVYCPRGVVYHEISATVGGADSAFKAYHKSRASLRLVRRHARGWRRPLAMLGRGVHDLASAGWLLLKARPAAAAAIPGAWIDALRGRTGHRVKDDARALTREEGTT